MNHFYSLMCSAGPRAVVLVRLIVGGTFLSEGIQKFLFPGELGVGRFAKIGIPMPEVLAPFVGVCEIVCGAMLVAGILTRLAAIPMIANISVAIMTTKLPILLHTGFWSAAHEARVDFAMLLGGIFLLIVGAGPWSVDRILCRRHAAAPSDEAEFAVPRAIEPPGGEKSGGG